MAENFDNPYSANLIGLWDFRDGYTTDDTGLGDGIAQDGTAAGGAAFAGGWMIGNGDGARLEVDGSNDAPFDLAEGSVLSVFRPGALPDEGSQTLVSRGAANAEGEADHFVIRVTDTGAVEISHAEGGASALLTTGPGFFAAGDVIKVVYGWSEGGVSMQVENETQGTTSSAGSDTPGLSLDVAAEGGNSFVIGASGNGGGAFEGAIDYVAVLDEDVTKSGLDGIVEGGAGDDLIDTGYTGDPDGDRIDNADAIDPNAGPDDDLVDAGGGDDTVVAGAGDDTVHGGAGSDDISGGEGDDVLLGDSTAPGAGGSSREVFQWDLAPDPDDGGEIDDGDDLSGGFSQDTGSVTVTYSASNVSAGVTSAFSEIPQFVGNINTGGDPADATSGLSSITDGDGNHASYALDFSDPVKDVSFRINDIDGAGVIQVTAFDADGNPIKVNLAGGPAVEMSDEDAVAGDDTATADGTYASDDNPDISMLVTIPGPVSSIVIHHGQEGTGNSGIHVSDVYFDAAVPPGEVVPGDDTIDGGDGDDVIIGGDGDDSLTGGDGNDDVDGGDGDDVIDTSGNEPGALPDRGFPGYAGTTPNIPAVPADPDPADDMDTVDGGAGNDLIRTGDDADLISGGSGMDTIDAGIDDDTVDGGEDDDLIIGGEGSDSLQGGDGADTLYGGLDPVFPDALNITDDGSDGRPADPDPTNGMDTLEGGAGDDVIYGQDDDDVLSGGEGDDTLDGGIDEDFVSGGAGNDVITGGHGDDTLEGGDDRDTFLGGEGFDQVDGGSGGDDFDTLDLRGLGPVGVVYTSADGEDGVAVVGSTGDIITFEEIENVLIDEPMDPDGIVQGTPDGEVIDVNYDGDPHGDFVDNDDAILPGQVGDQDIIVAGDGDDTIDAGLDNDLVFAGNGDDAVSGEDGDDTILGQDGNDLLEGDGGDDVIHGGDGDDTLDAGRGDDTLRGGDGNDNLTGNPGDDVLYGGDGDDTVIGNDGSDTLHGGAGDDTISTGPGNDEVSGGDDRDTIIVVGQDDQYVDGNEGGDDYDTLVVFGNAEVEYDPDNAENGVVYYLDDSDVRTGVTTTFVNIENVDIRNPQIDGVVEGGSGDDLIDASYTGDPEGDRIDNFDSLENFLDEPISSLTPSEFFEDLGGTPRGDQRDAVDAGAGNDTVYSGAGDDIVKGREGNDLVFSGLGFDDVDGGEGDDTLDGGAGSDKLYGGEGNDSLIGGLGGDTLVGGEGSDTLDAGLGDNFVDAGAGDDLVTGENGDDTLFGGDGADTILAGGGDDVVVAYDPQYTGVASIGRTADSIDGGAGNDQLAGGSGMDTIHGGEGDDTLFGGIAGDELNGDAGDDVIYGDSDLSMETPDDIAEALAIEPGDDTITGGAGADTVFGEYGDDFIDAGTGDDSVEGGVGSDAILGGEGDDDLSGGADSDLVVGGEGNDLVSGGEGVDLLGGGAGDDTIDGGADTDGVFGGEGNDSLVGAGGSDLILGGEGDDVIAGDAADGGEGNSEDGAYDVLLGGAGNDTITGGTGDDLIDGGEGDDEMTGGADADTFIEVGPGDVIDGSETGNDNDTIVINGPAVVNYDPDNPENGTIDFYDLETQTVIGTATFTNIENIRYVEDIVNPVSALSSAPETHAPGDPAPDAPPVPTDIPDPGPGVVDGTDGRDVIDLDYDGDPEGDRIDNGDAILPGEGPDDDIVLAGAGDDDIFSAEGDDDVFAGEGDDLVSGGAGDDVLRGQEGDDLVFGETGNDQLSGGAGNDTMDGGTEDDVLSGGSGDDELRGNIGNDFVAGGSGDDLIEGGEGNDLLLGGSGLDTIDVGNADGAEDLAFGGFGSDNITGLGVGDTVYGGEDADDSDIDVLDLRGVGDPDGTVEVEFDPTDGEAGTVTFFDASGAETGTAAFFEIEEVIMPCFTPGTLIATPLGERRVEDLKAGDRVITRDNGIQEIRWLGKRSLKTKELSSASHLQPVLIRQGALGNGLPERDMMVSPNHRVLVANDKTALYFEDREVLVAAKHLTGLEGVDAVETTEVTYIHFMFDQHEVVLSDGAWTESFQPGDQSLRGLDNAQRNEVFELFPELKSGQGREGYTSARRSLKKHEARLLVH